MNYGMGNGVLCSWFDSLTIYSLSSHCSGDRQGEAKEMFKRPQSPQPPGLVHERARKRTVFQLLTESARKTLRGNKQPRETTNQSLR